MSRLTDQSCSFLELCRRNNWVLSVTAPTDQKVTHLLLDGGKLAVPLQAIDDFNRALFSDIINRKQFFVVERRRGDYGSLVLDLDYHSHTITTKQSESFGLKVANHIFGMHVANPEDKRVVFNKAIFSSCTGSPNLHIAFPAACLSQSDCIRILCTLPRMMYTERHNLLGFETCTVADFTKILDISVVTVNGVRTNGSRKCTKCSNCEGMLCSVCGGSGKVVSGPDRVYMVSNLLTPGAPTVSLVPRKLYSEEALFRMTLINRACAKHATFVPTYGTLFFDSVRFDEEISRLHHCRDQDWQTGNPEKILGGPDKVSKLLLGLAELYPVVPKIKEVRVLGQKIKIIFASNDANANWCANNGGRHKNNSTFVIGNLSTGTLVQRCHCSCPKEHRPKPCRDFCSEPVTISGWEQTSVTKKRSCPPEANVEMDPVRLKRTFLPVSSLRERTARSMPSSTKLHLRAFFLDQYISMRICTPPNHPDFQHGATNNHVSREVAKMLYHSRVKSIGMQGFSDSVEEGEGEEVPSLFLPFNEPLSDNGF